MSPAENAIARRFGTARGLIRLLLSHMQIAGIARSNPQAARRLVFVCHGNICRSSFADVLAQKLGARTASFGLSTSTGKPAHPPVTAAAQAMGIDLAAHRTTAVEDFVAQPGDLYLVMEIRQIAKLRAMPGFADAPIDLLGRYAGVPHLHDPYELSAGYTDICLQRIERAVTALVALSPAARL